MLSLNRTAILVKPRQPFLDWLRWADPTSGELSLEDIRKDPTIYLLPECDSDAEARGYLEVACGPIFEEELDGWHRVPEAWPIQRDMEAFERWFEWSVHSIVIDLSGDPLLHEEL